MLASSHQGGNDDNSVDKDEIFQDNDNSIGNYDSVDDDIRVDDDNPVDDDDELGCSVVFDCVCCSMNGETGMSHAERRAQLEAANKVVFTFSFISLFRLLTNQFLSFFVHCYVTLLTRFFYFLISSVLFLTFNFWQLPSSTFFTFTLISFLAILDL